MVLDGNLSNKKSVPTFIDFEASSLNMSVSFPIEVAWNDQDGQVKSCLINPVHVPEWTDWDFEAEAVHGIQRQELTEHGLAPVDVCKILLSEVGGRIIYSDAPDFDLIWLKKLMGAGGRQDASLNEYKKVCLLDHSLLIYDILYLKYNHIQGSLRETIIHAKIEEIRQLARERVPVEHRAADDVMYLMEQWKLAGES